MGDEATKTYKYTSNKDEYDGTEEIRLPGREPVRKGGEIELTEAEHSLLSGRLNLRAVNDSEGSNSDEGSSSRVGQGDTANQGSGSKLDAAK